MKSYAYTTLKYVVFSTDWIYKAGIMPTGHFLIRLITTVWLRSTGWILSVILEWNLPHIYSQLLSIDALVKRILDTDIRVRRSRQATLISPPTRLKLCEAAPATGSGAAYVSLRLMSKDIVTDYSMHEAQNVLLPLWHAPNSTQDILISVVLSTQKRQNPSAYLKSRWV